MSARAKGSGGWASGAAAMLALAAAGWFGLGLTTHSPQPSLILADASNGSDASAAGSGGLDSTIPVAWRGDRTRPRMHPEVRPAVVRQGQSVVFLAHRSLAGIRPDPAHWFVGTDSSGGHPHVAAAQRLRRN